MTGLYSRDYFFWAVRQHDLHHPYMAMDAILIDINNFHIINERFGTKVGNTIIKRLAAHLRKLSIKRQEEHLLSFNSVYTKTKRRPVSFTRVATALISGYESVVFVDLKTDQFIEYRRSETRKRMHHQNSGSSFFKDIYTITTDLLPPEDHEKLRCVLERKDEILQSMTEKSFSMFYRLIEDGKPIWHFLRAILSKDKEYLAIGIISVQDAFNDLPCGKNQKDE